MIFLKPHRELEHTADFRVEIRAWTWRGLLQNAVSAFSATISEPKSIEAKEMHLISCRADRRDELVMALLKQVHLLFEMSGFLSQRLVIRDCSPLHLEAELWGENYDTTRHPLKREVKAITYHALEVKRRFWAWRARVVFDI